MESTHDAKEMRDMWQKNTVSIGSGKHEFIHVFIYWRDSNLFNTLLDQILDTTLE